MTSPRMGIELPCYDGVSVWVCEDGTLINRWEHYKDDCPGSHMRQRYDTAQQWIEQQKEEEAA